MVLIFLIGLTSRALNRAFALDIAPFIVIFLSADDVEGLAPLLGAFPRDGGLLVSLSCTSSWAKRSSRTASSCSGAGVAVAVAVAVAATTAAAVAVGDAFDFFNFPIKAGGGGGGGGGLRVRDDGGGRLLRNVVAGRRSRRLVSLAVRPNRIAENAKLVPSAFGGRGGSALELGVGFIRNGQKWGISHFLNDDTL